MVAFTSPARAIRAGTCHVRGTTGSTMRVGSRSFVPVSYPDRHHDQLLIVRAVTEEPMAEVRGAVVESASWQLNGIGDLHWSAKASDSALLSLVDSSTIVDGAGRMQLVGREAQLWRDGVLIWAGPPVTGTVNLDGTVSVSCSDQGWYLTRRVFGLAQRRDLLRGIGGMDRSGLPGWTATGACTAHRSTTVKARGRGSAALAGAGTIESSFTMATIDRGQDAVVRVTAVVKLPTGTPVGTGMVTVTVRGVAGGAIVAQESVSVDGETHIGGWTNADVTVNVPLYGPHYITVTLWSLGTHGTTYFDDVRSLRNDTTGIPSPGADLCTHAVAALNHWQSIGTWGFRPRIVHNTGTVETMGVRHLEHTQASDYMRTLTERDDGLDWWVEPIRREFVVSNRRGVDHRHLALHDRTVTAGGFSHDIADVASREIVIGDGDGADRPEGGYDDRSRTGGLALDDVYRPPNGTPLAALDPMAKQRHKSLTQPQETLDRMVVSEDLLDLLQPGDTVPSTAKAGVFRTGERMRVQKITLDPEAGTLELV